MLKKIALCCWGAVSLGLWGGEINLIESVRSLWLWKPVKKIENRLPAPLPFKGIIFDCPGRLIVHEGPEFQVRRGSCSLNLLSNKEFVAESPILIIEDNQRTHWNIILPFYSSKVFGLLKVKRGRVVIAQKYLRCPVKASVAHGGTLMVEGEGESRVIRSVKRQRSHNKSAQNDVLPGGLAIAALHLQRSQSQQDLRQKLKRAQLGRSSTAP